MLTRPGPRFAFSHDTPSSKANAWVRARALHDARSYMAVKAGARRAIPFASRAFRHVRRDATRVSTTSARGWLK